MGDADRENLAMIDNNPNSDDDEPTGTEIKKMRVDDGETEDTEMTSVEVVESSGGVLSKDDKPKDVTSNLNDSNAVAATVASDSEANHQKDNIETITDCSTTSEESGSNAQVPDTTTSDTLLPLADSTSTAEEPAQEEDFGEEIELKIIFNKKPLLIKIQIKKTVGHLKLLIEKQTGLPPGLQKVLLKGIPKDEVTLESLGVTKSTKILVIGTTLNEVMEVTKPPDKEALAAEDLSSKKDAANWCSVTQHKKILDKGVPQDVMPGILNESEPLPEIPLFGMLNSKGGKVRLTFKLETDELWIGTKERTDKIPLGSIRNIESQAIVGYEHYHIIAIQLGPTEASRYFVYWVPSQYVDAIKDSLAN